MKNEVATKKDIEALKNKLLDKMVDKDQYQKDMAQLVTKEEFKKELDKLLTKEEFREQLKKEYSRYATKDELRFEINELRKEMREANERHDQRYNKILEILDGIAKQISNSRVEKAAVEATLQRHERKLEDHQVRIERLESKRT